MENKTAEAAEPQVNNDEDLESMQILDSFQDGDEETNEEQPGDTSYDPTVPTDESAAQNDAKEAEAAPETSTNGAVKTVDPRRMSGAARKRYKYFLATGHDRDEARKLALDKLVKITDWAKVEELSNKNRKEAESKRDLDADTIKVGILPDDYPLVSLSKEDMETIQGDILNKVLEKGGEIKPKFMGAIYKTGWFILRCANKATAEWIKGISSEIQGPGGQALKIVDNAEIPKTIMMYAYFPKSAEDNDEKVLQLIGAQNEKLNISQWRVTQREIEGPALRLSIAIDPASDEVLQKLEYRVAYKFGFVNLRTEDKEKERKALRKRPPPPSKKKGKPDRRPSPPPRRKEPKRFERARERATERRGGRGGGRFEDRRSRRGGGPPRFSPRSERERRRGGREDRFDDRFGDRRDSRDRRPDPPHAFGFPNMPSLPKMPPSQGFPGGSWSEGGSQMYGPPGMDMGGKSNDEMSIYFTQLKSLEEYNRSLGQQQQQGGGSQGGGPQGGGGTWYTQGPYGGNRR